MPNNPRLLATQILYRVTEEHISLAEHSLDTPFIQALCYGVCRHYEKLQSLTLSLLEKPLRKKDQDIHVLLLIGLYQLIEMRLPDHAVINETVEVAVLLKKPWAKNLINAILRKFQREKETTLALINKQEAPFYSHPPWLIKKTKAAWPNDWEKILSENNQHPPMTLRVNTQKINRDTYLERLIKNEIPGKITTHVESGILLESPRNVSELPEFLQGFCSVQDAAAQLAAPLLQLKPGHCVLDACAAPGGKTTHLLELQPDIQLTALDISKKRCEQIHENLHRLNLKATVKCEDAFNIKNWWDNKKFDRILLDAPCSATGVIRRHPDIKLLRRESDIQTLQKTQLNLLNTLWPLLKREGLLLYATCSILPEENEKVIEQFLQSMPSAKIISIEANWGMKQTYGRQVLPGQNNMDGFYYALLTYE